MTTSIIQASDDDVTPLGAVKVSPSALDYARAFVNAVRDGRTGDWIATFSWCEAISLKRGPHEPYEDIGPCITLGAFERRQIPSSFIHVVDGFEFAIQIPRAV